MEKAWAQTTGVGRDGRGGERRAAFHVRNSPPHPSPRAVSRKQTTHAILLPHLLINALTADCSLSTLLGRRTSCSRPIPARCSPSVSLLSLFLFLLFCPGGAQPSGMIVRQLHVKGQRGPKDSSNYKDEKDYQLSKRIKRIFII